jgi:hypothetical protein
MHEKLTMKSNQRKEVSDYSVGMFLGAIVAVAVFYIFCQALLGLN